MLSLLRPAARPDFAPEAADLLSAVRSDLLARKGAPCSDDFKRRDLWSGSWKRDGRHKKALAGAGVVSAKCAWCERIRDVSRELDVEHHRPKVAVTEWAGQPLLVSDVPPEEIDVGPGYWWLAFSWTNYSLSCKACNQEWKRNLFPVAAPRAACLEGVERTEQPLLLDPCAPFRTADHFEWTVDAVMNGLTPEGRATIITCGLNRSPLVALRLKVAQDARALLKQLLGAIRRRDAAEARRGLQELGNLGSRSREFAGMVRWYAEKAMRREWHQIEGLSD